MRKIITFIIIGSMSIFIVSCNSARHETSSFGKRKYTKGYFADLISFNPHLASKNFIKSNEDEKLSVSTNTNKTVIQNTPGVQEKSAILKTIQTKTPLDLKTKNKNSYPLPENCDELVLTDGTIIDAQVEEIGIDIIKYKECNNLDGPDIILAKSRVLSIRYKNGKIVHINTSDTNNYYSKSPAAGKTHQNNPPNGMAVASLVCGIAGLLLIELAIPSVLAIIFGIVALTKIKKYPDRYGQKTLAILGIVFGGVAIALIAAFFILIFLLL
jgi:hypothetical protein